MVRQGLIKPSPIQRQPIKVHTIGRSPEHESTHDFDDWVFSGGKTYKQETWEIGTDVTVEQAAEYRDPSTGELYVYYQIVDNEWKGRFVSRELFLKIKAVHDL
ncbi:MAG TPA: hypothetical protein DDZ51_07945 [Planctomycetaceae bacterium]|nr:hypothetical protein [Planctomycetaceae bacterium]